MAEMTATHFTFEQEVKLQLVALAEYLQVKDGLSDMQVKMYAHELMELGKDGLERAISLLKEDPDVWAGRMPLPAKLKQYVWGDMSHIANEIVGSIMRVESVKDAYLLPPFELMIAKEYGIHTIVNRSAEQSPTIYAQLRAKAFLKLKARREAQVGHDRRDGSAHLLTAGEEKEKAGEHGGGLSIHEHGGASGNEGDLHWPP